MTRNKEAVLSEKDLSCHFGQTCLVGYADPIDPAGFASFEEFMAALQKAWDAEWKRVYSAQLSGINPQQPSRKQQLARQDSTKHFEKSSETHGLQQKKK